MKWFITTNESSLNNDSFFQQIQVAIASALKNTSLQPHLVYDGGENDKLCWLKDNGVVILHHQLTFSDAVTDYVMNNSKPEVLPELATVRTGSYLKSEIPLAIKNHGIEDRFVLYTDCDVVFLKQLNLDDMTPRYLAAYGGREGGYTRFRIGGWNHFQAGVLVMNVDAMHKESDQFRRFVLANGFGTKRPKSEFMQKNLFLSDQVALNLFYKGRFTNLDKTYNWHPTRGVDQEAKIIHFNGLKWTQWDDFLAGKLLAPRMVKFTRLVNKNRNAFEHYVSTARSYLAKINVNCG